MTVSYTHLDVYKRQELKDVGGFVGGTFINDRRKSSYVQGRDILTDVYKRQNQY